MWLDQRRSGGGKAFPGHAGSAPRRCRPVHHSHSRRARGFLMTGSCIGILGMSDETHRCGTGQNGGGSGSGFGGSGDGCSSPSAGVAASGRPRWVTGLKVGLLDAAASASYAPLPWTVSAVGSGGRGWGGGSGGARAVTCTTWRRPSGLIQTKLRSSVRIRRQPRAVLFMWSWRQAGARFSGVVGPP
jgi:hypothetical protein